MITWNNELHRDEIPLPLGGGSPAGTVEITRTEERDGNTYIWYAPVPASPAGTALPADPLTMLGTVAALHNECYEAWQAAGFTEAQAFELVKEVVAAAYRPG